jgi:hypothetical protein
MVKQDGRPGRIIAAGPPLQYQYPIGEIYSVFNAVCNKQFPSLSMHTKYGIQSIRATRRRMAQSFGANGTTRSTFKVMRPLDRGMLEVDFAAEGEAQAKSA